MRALLAFGLAAAFLAGCRATPGDVVAAPVDLRTDGQQSPLGIGAGAPILSWRLTGSRRGILQRAFQVVATRDVAAGVPVQVWDSGRVASGEARAVWGGPTLESRTRYLWKVRTWEDGDDPSPWSEEGFFEAGLLAPDDWSATWIARDVPAAADEDARTSLLRRDFNLEGQVMRARLHVTALGNVELHLNGSRVGDGWLAPGWTDYLRRVQVETHDVTALVRAGPNAIGALLATGWYAGRIGALGKDRYGSGRPGVLAQLEVTYQDGTRETVTTDGSWRTTQGPFLSVDHLDGESYDARAEEGGWDSPGFDDSRWQPVVPKTDVPAGLQRVARLDPPVRVTQVIAPVSVRRLSPDVQMVDLGQNMVGVVRLRVNGAPAGVAIQLRHGEALLPDGALFTENLRTARATDRYVTSGRAAEEWSPRFTFHGFRYVEVTGYPGDIEPGSVAGLVLGTDAPITGHLSTSSRLLDRLQANITWSQRGNFLSIPTDCPQRDERLGWTGDIAVFAATAAFNMDVSRFLGRKWLADLRDGMDAAGVPTFVPTAGLDTARGDIQWGSAAIQVPYAVWQAYGDARVIEENWGMMSRAMQYWRAAAGEDLILDTPSYGDWLALEESSIPVLDTAWLKHDADAMARMALATGRVAEASAWTEFAGAVRMAFASTFVTVDGRVLGPAAEPGAPPVESQAQYALALAWELLPDAVRPLAADRLVARLEATGWHLATGFQGTPLLLDALSSAGRPEVAWRVLMQETAPSWLFEVKTGATTTWERWDAYLPDGTLNLAVSGLSSLNHYALGAVGNWMYRNVAGIQLDPRAAGYRRSIVRPEPGGGVDSATGSIETVHGTLAVDWAHDGEGFRIDVIVPPNTVAEVHVPATDLSGVTEGPFAVASAPGVTALGLEGGRAVVEVGSGTWSFRSRVR